MGGVYVIFIIAQGMLNVTRPEDIKVGFLCLFLYDTIISILLCY